MDDNQLFQLNDVGLIPGPDETLDSFQERVDYCLSEKNDLLEEPLDTSGVLKTAFPLTKKHYGIEPAWVPLFFSNRGLSLWHGGAAWIFQVKENDPLGALLQLRKSFFHKSGSFLYSREEIIAHELSHIGRMAFQESQFEELIAYQTSSRSWIKYFGPIVGEAFESRLFVILLLFIMILDIALLFLGSFDAYMSVFWLKSLPLLMIAFAAYRLFKRHSTFNQALKNLKENFNDPHAVIYRLTDAEIVAFSKSPKIPVIQEDQSLRWHLLRSLYLKSPLN